MTGKLLLRAKRNLLLTIKNLRYLNLKSQFILQDVAEKMITCPEVVAEITNKRQLRRLVVLPYDLIVKEAFPENVHIITEFAKKTGDYPSLSATDIKVMALTYQLEKEKVGIDHLRTEPIMQKPIITTKKTKTNLNADVTGFYKPGKNKKIVDGQEETQTKARETDEETIENVASSNDVETQDQKTRSEDQACNNNRVDQNCDKLEKSSDDKVDNVEETPHSDEEDYEVNDDEEEELDEFDEDKLTEQLKNLELECSESMENAEDVDSLLVSVKEEKEDEDYIQENDNEEQADDDDDDSGWITPSNIQIAKKQFKSDLMESKKVVVACMTTDFAMQNVLKQMNLNVSALDGRLIKQLRTFILRCYTCFKTTSLMTKKFCPKCGNNTLKKVAVSLDKNGKMKIHINPKHPLTARGKKYSLPTIKGGKHPNNPILVEDQPMPDNRPTRLARTKTNPLDDDYIAGEKVF